MGAMADTKFRDKPRAQIASNISSKIDKASQSDCHVTWPFRYYIFIYHTARTKTSYLLHNEVRLRRYLCCPYMVDCRD